MERNREKKEDEFKRKLTPEQYHVLRKKDTERAFSGHLLKNNEKGDYSCAACGQVIFRSETKFDSGTGWPSFYDAVEGSVELKRDRSHLMIRTEVRCSRCKSHLGHVFGDGPKPTGKRYCINSIALDFKKSGKKKSGDKNKGGGRSANINARN